MGLRFEFFSLSEHPLECASPEHKTFAGAAFVFGVILVVDIPRMPVCLWSHRVSSYRGRSRFIEDQDTLSALSDAQGALPLLNQFTSESLYLPSRLASTKLIAQDAAQKRRPNNAPRIRHFFCPALEIDVMVAGKQKRGCLGSWDSA